MATATMATAAGAAALLYYTLNKKMRLNLSKDDNDEYENVVAGDVPVRNDRVPHRLIQAPATWLETIATLSETLRFTYSETLGKWPIGDLAFGISFLLKRQGNLHVSREFGGKDSLQLKGPEIAAELRSLLNLLNLCWHFSKKPFGVFLEETGYSQADVLLQEPKAGILKPAFTVLVDHKNETLLLLIRGTHSIKDTLTAATGAVVPFHHTVVSEGGVSNLVLGYAHCGMVAAARWIAKLATPCLVTALDSYPHYRFKIIGHSLGGGTAALLTYILRERKELSTASCVAFAPAACMTWELAESGNEFITSIINGADMVPTFSAASVDDLRTEVTASAWLSDLRNRIEHTRILSTVYRSASALGSRLPSMANAKAKVAGAGAILRPVSNRTQVVMKRAQSMAQAALSRPALGSWSCIGPRRRSSTSQPHSNFQDEESSSNQRKPFLAVVSETTTIHETMELPVSSSEETLRSSGGNGGETNLSNSTYTETDDGIMDHERYAIADGMTEVELWQQIEHELYEHVDSEGADVVKEMKAEEEEMIAKESDGNPQSSVLNAKEVHRFFPVGKIMHIVTLVPDDDEQRESDGSGDSSSESEEREEYEDPKVGIFLTPRLLYSKLRLSQTMIADHFMPVYRRQIEKVIKEIENEATSSSTR